MNILSSISGCTVIDPSWDQVGKSRSDGRLSEKKTVEGPLARPPFDNPVLRPVFPGVRIQHVCPRLMGRAPPRLADVLLGALALDRVFV
jgi:hypothetical protein